MHICRNNQYPARGRKYRKNHQMAKTSPETINTPLGDGNGTDAVKDGRTYRNNQYPARGRKSNNENKITESNQRNNQYPARGRKYARHLV